MLIPLLGSRPRAGPACAAEVRLLAAHANMLYETAADLSPSGVHAARSTLIELAKAVARRSVDDVEPLLAPALAQAAKDLADRRLADPELSAVTLARELSVSVRTLQRAFAAAGESVSIYVRGRRLEEARLALTAPAGRLSVTELAAHWRFADSSHFTRAFKKHYGRTPTDYARSVPLTGNLTVTTGGFDKVSRRDRWSVGNARWATSPPGHHPATAIPAGAARCDADCMARDGNDRRCPDGCRVRAHKRRTHSASTCGNCPSNSPASPSSKACPRYSG